MRLVGDCLQFGAGGRPAKLMNAGGTCPVSQTPLDAWKNSRPSASMAAESMRSTTGRPRRAPTVAAVSGPADRWTCVRARPQAVGEDAVKEPRDRPVVENRRWLARIQAQVDADGVALGRPYQAVTGLEPLLARCVEHAVNGCGVQVTTMPCGAGEQRVDADPAALPEGESDGRRGVAIALRRAHSRRYLRARPRPATRAH